MKIRGLFFLLAGLFLMPLNSDGQIGYLRNRIVDKIIDNAIDSLDQSEKSESTENQNANTPAPARSTTGTSTTTQSKPAGTSSSNQQNPPSQGGFNLGNLGFGKVDLKYKDEYNFTGSIYMKMESYDKKEVTKMDYYTYYNNSTPNAAIEVKSVETPKESDQVNSVFIFDGENKCFIILTDAEGNKSGIISPIPSDSALKAQNTSKPVTPPTIVKTGKTKVIAGYKCDEYRVTDTEAKTYSNVWASKDLNLKADRSNWSKAGLPAYTSEFEGGIVLAMEVYDDKDVLEMKTETIEIKENIKHSVSPTGYTLMQMSF